MNIGSITFKTVILSKNNMAMVGPLPILEIPSNEGYHHPDVSPTDTPSLEEAIRSDFGESGLERFRSYNVQIEAPTNMGFRLGFNNDETYRGFEEGKSFKDGKPGTIGRVYEITMFDEIESISANNVNTRLIMHKDRTPCLSLTLDLNPENKESRYMRMLFR